MDPRHALIGAVAFFVLQLAGRFVAGQPHPWRDSAAGAAAFAIALIVGPAIGGVVGIAILVVAVVGLLLLATIHPDQWEAFRRRRR